MQNNLKKKTINERIYKYTDELKYEWNGTTESNYDNNNDNSNESKA